MKIQPTQRQTNTDMVTGGEIHLGGQGGLNFTGFADSRKGGSNAMEKDGGSREREWGILTVTYRQRAEQSTAEQRERYEQFT